MKFNYKQYSSSKIINEIFSQNAIDSENLSFAIDLCIDYLWSDRKMRPWRHLITPMCKRIDGQGLAACYLHEATVLQVETMEDIKGNQYAKKIGIPLPHQIINLTTDDSGPFAYWFETQYGDIDSEYQPGILGIPYRSIIATDSLFVGSVDDQHKAVIKKLAQYRSGN